jgi:hypothetical protein
MSLLRLAFWLALIVMLLPTDAQQQARFADFANQAMGRVSTFCDRNSRTCGVGSDAWSTFLSKAEFGVRLIGDLLGAGGRRGPDAAYDPGPQPGPQDAYRRPYRGRGGPAPDRRPYYYPGYYPGRGDPRGTLSPSDLYEPPWRGPPQRPYYYGG